MGIRDAMYGQAIGDALGVPYEFKPRGSFRCTGMTGYGTHDQPAGTWSDDTSMALATCDSYRELGRIDVDDMRRRFEHWLHDSKYTVGGVFDVGGTTARALESGHGMDGIRDNGNGSLMRIVPLAFMGASEADVRNVSAITHAHAISISCCKGMVDVATRLSEGQSVADVGHELVDASRDEAEIRSSGYVRDTFGAALWCLATTSSYAECVLKAVNLGDDTDTTAAVAGALAGIAYGANSIPGEWMSGLLGKDIIESCLF